MVTEQSQNTYNVDGPAWVLLILDRLKEALGSIVGVRASEFTSFLVVQDLESLIGPDVNLGVNVASVPPDVFEGVTGISMHVMVPVGGSTVGEED